MKRDLIRYIILLELVFVVSRLIFLSAGVLFPIDDLSSFLQYIDVELLKSRLFESIFYLHGQPPLFNLFLGVVLKLFPENYAVVFQLIYLAGGQLLMGGLFLLMVRMRVLPAVAFVLTALFMVSPAVILYENLLFYEYPACIMMVWAALMLVTYSDTKRPAFGVLFYFLLLGLALLKSVFHLFWFVFIMVAVQRALKNKDRKAFFLWMIPLILLLSAYLKNFIVFGTFSMSQTVLSDSLVHMATHDIPAKKLLEYVREGKISFLTASNVLVRERLVEPNYVRRLVHDEYLKVPKTGIPVLDRFKKSGSYAPNWHSLFFHQRSYGSLKDVQFLVKKHPGSYMISVRRAFLLYFCPGPTDVLLGNREKIARYEDLYNFMFARLNHLNANELYTEYLFAWYKIDLLKWDMLAIALFCTVAAGYVLLVVFGFYRMFRWHRMERKPEALTMFFMLFNIVYLFLFCTGLTWIGNNRYRFNIEPFYWVLLGLLLTALLERVKGGPAPRQESAALP